MSYYQLTYTICGVKHTKNFNTSIDMLKFHNQFNAAMELLDIMRSNITHSISSPYSKRALVTSEEE